MMPATATATGEGPTSDSARSEPDWDNVLQFTGAGPGDASGAAGPAGDGEAGFVMSQDDFFTAFRFLFDLPNMAIKPPLETLPIAADDAQARAAADAIYKTCLEVAWLRWILAPENEYVQRAFVIGLFFAGKGKMVRAELIERGRARQAAAEPPKPAAAPEPPKPVNQPVVDPGPDPEDGQVIGQTAKAA